MPRLAAEAGLDQAPGDIGGHRQAVVAQALPGVFVHQAPVVLPRAVAFLLREQPARRALEQGRVDVVHAAHIAELLQAVGGQHAVGRLVAKQGEPAAALDLKGGQALVAQVDVLLGFHLDFGRGLVGGLEVIQHQHVGIGGGGGLLEAAVGHAQDAVQPFHHLAEHAGVDLDDQVLRAGDGALPGC